MIEPDVINSLRNRIDKGYRSLLPIEYSDSDLSFYGVPKGQRDFYLMHEELRSWFKSPISSSITILHPDEHKLHQLTEEQVFLVHIETGWEECALTNIKQLLTLWELEPELNLNLNRPIGRILRDFYRGITVSDRNACELALQEIKNAALLSPINILFLEIEISSRLGTPEEVIGNSQFKNILRFNKRPSKVTDFLAKAIDALYISPKLTKDSFDWDSLSKKIRDLYPNLLGRETKARSPEGARCLALIQLFNSTKDDSSKEITSYLELQWSHDKGLAKILQSSPYRELAKEEPSNTLKELERCLLADEDRSIEYKSTLMTPVGVPVEETEIPSQRDLQNTCIKTVAAFFNTDGGTLLIGISDDKSIIGIESDYERLRKEGRSDRDRFILHFSQLIKNALGAVAESVIDIDICEYKSNDIAVIKVPESQIPVYANMKLSKKVSKTLFYYRGAAGTQSLEGADLEEYLSKFSITDTIENTFNEDNFKLCIEMVSKIEQPSLKNFENALVSVLKLNDTELSTKIFTIYDSLSEEDKSNFRKQTLFLELYENLETQLGGRSIPSSWLDWLNGESWLDDPYLLSTWSDNWADSQTLDEDESEEITLSLIDALNDNRRVRTLNGLSLFIDWLIKEESELPPNLINLGVACYETILEGDPGILEYKESFRLMESILNSSFTRDHYQSFLTTTNKHIEFLGAIRADWLCEIFELITRSTTRDEQTFLQFKTFCSNYFKSHFEKLSLPDRLTLKRLLIVNESLIDFDEEINTTVPTPSLTSLAIHSLHKPTVENFKEMIQSEWPDMQVEIDSDSKVDNKELKNMAERVDLMIIHTSRMKHAVSNFGQQKNILKVHGGGATRLFREFVSWLNS